MQLKKMYTSIDAHVAGESYRVIIHSPLQLADPTQLKAGTIADPFVKQAKQLLLQEPRGHIGMKGCVILFSQQADYYMVFLHQEIDDYFSYSGLAASLTVLLETGQIPVKKDGFYTVETNRGIYTLSAEIDEEKVENIQISIPKAQILEETDKISHIEIDNGRRYFLYPLPSTIPTLEPAHLTSIMKWGKQMTHRLRNQAFDGITLVEIVTHVAVRTVTFEPDGMILRSPGFDTTFAILLEQTSKDERVSHIINKSIFNSEMQAFWQKGKNGACTIEVKPFVTGEHHFLLDPEDPLKNGFLLK